MSDRAPAGHGGNRPADASEEHESWLREAARAPQATRLPRPGDVVGGKYRIEDLLGRGGMGVVFRARHLVSERPVAIKWMLRSAADEQARRRFEREARAAGRIDHPNVVSLFDIGMEGDCSYLVMELLRGESLRARVRRGRLAPTEAVDVLIPAMRGVAAAHRAGVVHRDLKPDNIFLCEPVEGGGAATAKVLDFGISSVASLEAADSTLTQEGTLLGSLAYMSPEQLRSPHDVDARTDVYAFGVIMYELLSGMPPFAGASHSALIVAIATTEPKRLSGFLPNVPSGLEQVVFRAFARNPEERYPNIASLVDALAAFASANVTGPRASGVPGVVAGEDAPGKPASAVATVPLGRASGEPAAAGETAAPTRLRPRLALAATVAVLLAAGLWAWLGGAGRATEPPGDEALPATAERHAPSAPASAPSVAAVDSPPPALATPTPTSPASPPTAVGHEARVAPAPPVESAATVPPDSARPRAATAQPVKPRRPPAKGSTADEAALFSGRK